MELSENRNLKKILKILLVILIMSVFCIFFQKQQVLAVESIELSSNKANIEKGEEFEITVSAPNTSIASLTLQIYFDMTKLEYVNKTENSNFSNNRVIYTWTDVSNVNQTGTIETFTFKALQDGIANIVVTGEFYDKTGNKVDINDVSMQIEIGKSQVEQISEEENENDEKISSDNTNLKIMRLNHEGISPEFQKSIKEYYFLADTSIHELEVIAIPENKNAIVKISGNTNLKQGLNTIKIEVQSEDKTKKSTYKIYVTKTNNKEIANSNLENLAVREGMLYPSFDANITHYDIEVANTVSKLEILAIPQSINAKVTIKGNDELKVGDNTITVNVTAEDGITNKKYVMTVHRRNEQEDIEAKEEQDNQAEQIASILENVTEEEEEVTESEKSDLKIVGIVVSIIIVICVVLIIIFYKKKMK